MPLVNGRFVADMKSPRTPDNEEPAAERACDFRPVDKGFTEEMALAEAERCLNCKKPFCVEGCPVNINIPRFIEQIRAKDFGGALDTIREDSMLPAICGRVCPQENQCEGKCIRGKKSEPVAIGQLERFLGDAPSSPPRPRWPPRTARRSPSSAPARPASPAPASSPVTALTLPSSRPSSPAAACWSTASPSSVCPRQSSSARLTAWRTWASSLSTTPSWATWPRPRSCSNRASTPSTWRPALACPSS